MFRIGRKQLVLRALLATLVFVVVLITGFCVMRNIREYVSASTADGGTVDIDVGSQHQYGNWQTNVYTVNTGGKAYIGVCADPQLDTPSGNYTVDLISPESNNQKMIKLILYIYATRSTSSESRAYLTQMFQDDVVEDESKYAFIHAIVGALNSNDYTGLNTEEIAWVNEQIGNLNTLVANNDSKWQMASRYNLYRTRVGGAGVQRIMWIEPKDLGKITVNKKDADSNSSTPVGDLTFDGITFTLKNSSGATVDTKTLTNGASSVVFENLEYGQYTIVESGASSGYNMDSNKTVNLSSASASTTFTNTPKKGKITVNKKDSQTNSCTTVGDAVFTGTKFQLVNNSDHAVYVGGTSYAKNAVIATKTLDTSTCKVEFTNLPYGKYIVKETAVGNGYTIDTNQKNVTMHSASDITVDFSNTPILGKVTVNKIDKDTGTCTNSRGLSFAGTTFTITNRSANAIYYNNHVVAKNAVIDTKTLTEGQCKITFDNLPYGTYGIKETVASKGYVRDTEEHTVTIPAPGSSQTNVSVTIADQPIRGDVKFTKMDATNNVPMRDVLFSISAIDDDYNIIETHIVVSDRDGKVDTSSSFIKHTKNTNGYDPLYDEVDPISFMGYGTWFGGYISMNDCSGGDDGCISEQFAPVTVRDDVGALPYGKYIIQELRCGSNLFCNNVLGQKVTITIDQANQVIDLGDWDNACIKFSIATNATDEKDGDKYIEVGKEVKLKDTIDYCVKPNTDFRIKGVLMDKSTGEPLLVNGEKVEEEINLRSEEDCGQTEMTFTFDASELGGKELVVFETLYYKDDIITKHDDIEDEGQTIEIVSLSTTATDNATGEKVLPLDEDVDIKDVVKYCLKPGVEYTLKGVLMDKTTGNALLVNSAIVESEVIFTPEEACGEVEMHFKINTANLGGKDLVVFENLYRDEELIIEHNDINNASQTVSVAPPTPDTGMFTTMSKNGQSSNGLIIMIGAPVIITVGYVYYRLNSRKRFYKR